MRKVIAGLFILGILGSWVYSAENRGFGLNPVHELKRPTNGSFIIRFSTKATANVKVQILSTMTATDFTLAMRGSNKALAYSPIVAASTISTHGGRMYTFLQFQSQTGTGNQKVYYDYSKNTISVTSSPYLTLGQTFSPDQGQAWQGDLWMQSNASFTITGWMWFERKVGNKN